MPNGEEWYLKPIELGFYTYSQLKDGTILIEDIAEINDYISIANENQGRFREATKRG